MKNNIKIIYLLIISMCVSCNNKTYLIKQQSDIIKDLLLQIITDERFYPLTPPPPASPFVEVKFKNGTIQNLKNDLYKSEYDNFVAKLDTNRHVIAIEDSTVTITNLSLIKNRLKESGYVDLIDLFKNNDSKTQLPIDTSQIKKIDRFEFIARSKVFPQGFNFRKYNGYDLTYYFYGNISFSKPFLNSSGDYGFIIYSRECGFECDRDYILIIKKQNNMWEIMNKINAR